MKTNILFQVEVEAKQRYERAAAAVGMSLSAWLRELADGGAECDLSDTNRNQLPKPKAVSPSADTALPQKPAPKVAPSPKASPPVKSPPIAKTAKDVVVPSVARPCGCFYCRTQRANGLKGTCKD